MERKKAAYYFRMTYSEQWWLQQAALSAGVTPSEYLRQAIANGVDTSKWATRTFDGDPMATEVVFVGDQGGNGDHQNTEVVAFKVSRFQRMALADYAAGNRQSMADALKDLFEAGDLRGMGTVLKPDDPSADIRILCRRPARGVKQ